MRFEAMDDAAFDDLLQLQEVRGLLTRLQKDKKMAALLHPR